MAAGLDRTAGFGTFAYPLPDLRPESWTRLPESGALAKLEAVAARRYCAAAGSVVAGPGSQALIQALSRILPDEAIGALGPTYSGFASGFGATGARFVEVNRFEELDGFDVG